jgi:hypothetical protein
MATDETPQNIRVIRAIHGSIFSLRVLAKTTGAGVAWVSKY